MSFEDEVDPFAGKELTEKQRECVRKLYERERGEHGIIGIRYRSVIFDKYRFQNGDDPFGLVNAVSVFEKEKKAEGKGGEYTSYHDLPPLTKEECKERDEKLMKIKESLRSSSRS